MEPEEERNFCPDCQNLVPLAAPRCPHCGRRFHPKPCNALTLYAQCWLLWNKCSGRAPLLEFYAFALPHTLVFIWSCFYLVNKLGARPWGEEGWESVLAAFDRAPGFYGLYAYFVLTLVPAFSLCCRRVHDSDRDAGDMADEAATLGDEAYFWTPWGRMSPTVSRWLRLPDIEAFILSPLLDKIGVFMYSIFAFFVHLPHLLFFEDSSPGPNRFGPATRYLRYQDGPMPRHPFN